MKKFLLLFFAVVTQLFFAQIEKHVKLNYDIKSIGENQYEAIITAKIDNGWHIYSKDIDPEVGAIPTEIKIISKDIELIGKATESGKKETSYSEAFAANLTTLSGNVIFKQKFKLKNPEKGSTIAAEVTYQTCNEKVCLAPETLEFEKKLKEFLQQIQKKKQQKKPLQKTVQKRLKQ
jgi:thiol:disulfide interchange protein DsbD